MALGFIVYFIECDSRLHTISALWCISLTVALRFIYSPSKTSAHIYQTDYKAESVNVQRLNWALHFIIISYVPFSLIAMHAYSKIHVCIQKITKLCTKFSGKMTLKQLCLGFAGCCRVLQDVAACCGVLQCVAVCCSVLQCVENDVGKALNAARALR